MPVSTRSRNRSAGSSLRGRRVRTRPRSRRRSPRRRAPAPHRRRPAVGRARPRDRRSPRRFARTPRASPPAARARPHEPLALQLQGHLLAGETPEAGPERGAQRLDGAELGWLRAECLDHPLVEIVVDHEVRLGREVAEHGRGRDLRRPRRSARRRSRRSPARWKRRRACSWIRARVFAFLRSRRPNLGGTSAWVVSIAHPSPSVPRWPERLASAQCPPARRCSFV